MKQVKFNQYEKDVSEDHNDAQLAVGQALFDETLYQLFQRQNGVINDAFVPTYVSALVATLDPGVGFFFDSSQVGYALKYQMIKSDLTINVPFDAADGTHDRIDLICLAPSFSVSGSETRFIKQGGTGPIVATSVPKTMDSTFGLQVVKGTPAASPAVPALPAGAIAIAQALIHQTTGLSGQNDLTDVRTILFSSAPSTVLSVTKAGMVTHQNGSLHTNTTIDGLTSNKLIALGAAVVGTGVQANTVVTGYVGTTGVTVSLATTATATSALTFTNPTHKVAIGDVLQAQLDQLDAAIPAVPGFGTGANVVLDPATQSPYTILPADIGKVFEVLTANGAMTFNLPAPAANFKFTVLDRDGSAITNPMTMHRAGSEKIQNLAADYIMEARHGRWDFTTEGTQWAF